MIPSKVYMVYFSDNWYEPFYPLGVFDSVEKAESHICMVAEAHKKKLKVIKRPGRELTITNFCRSASEIYPDILCWAERGRFVSHKEFGWGVPTDDDWDENLIGVWEVYEYKMNDVTGTTIDDGVTDND